MTKSIEFIEPETVVAFLNDSTKTPNKDYRIIDVRLPEQYTQSHIPTAINVPTDDLLTSPQQVYEQNKDAGLLIFHCVHSEKRGPACATAVRDVGTEEGGPKIVVLKGGYARWEKEIGNELKTGEKSLKA